MAQYTAQLSCLIDPDTKRWIEEEAKREGVWPSVIIRALIREGKKSYTSSV